MITLNRYRLWQHADLAHGVSNQVGLVEGEVDVFAELADPDVLVAGVLDPLVLEDGVTADAIAIWREKMILDGDMIRN